VADAIMHELKHGVTALSGKGMYTGEEKTLLLCVARRHETSRLKRLVLDADPGAFVLLSEVGEVFGQGFKAYEK
ncbi:MAG: YitT family protein, partial [Clostridia bacterium]|nr:YitT family protein [Clostridia bacterium]